MQEALMLVRRELGMKAVILHTKQLSHRRLLPFLKPRQEVEITAGVGANLRAANAKPEPVRPEPVAIKPTPQPVAPPKPLVDDDDEGLTGISKAAKLAAELERRHAEKLKLQQSIQSIENMTGTKAISPEQADELWSKEAPQARQQKPPVETNRLKAFADNGPALDSRDQREPAPSRLPSPTTSAPVPETMTRREPAAAKVATDQAAHLLAAMNAAAASSQAANTNNTTPVVAELTQKLDALQKMVESLARTSQLRTGDEIPAELFDIYTNLIDADIEDDLAREMVFRLKQECTPDQLHDTAATRAILSAMVEKDIRCANPIRPSNGRRKVVALVGPTGVGKTTTIAKLAANFRLRDGIKMGLVTVDTYRIAAVEQLRTYAEIIDLPMKVVTTSQDMRRALDELSGLDLVLIDTAGRSPRDELKIQELKQMLGEAQIDEVHLVMSLTASVRSIRMTAEQFGPVNPTALVLTKLDEAAGMGCLLSVSRQVQLPLSYLTTGQDVPDDIEPAHPNRVSRLVLGQDRLFD